MFHRSQLLLLPDSIYSIIVLYPHTRFLVDPFRYFPYDCTSRFNFHAILVYYSIPLLHANRTPGWVLLFFLQINSMLTPHYILHWNFHRSSSYHIPVQSILCNLFVLFLPKVILRLHTIYHLLPFLIPLVMWIFYSTFPLSAHVPKDPFGCGT